MSDIESDIFQTLPQRGYRSYHHFKSIDLQAVELHLSQVGHEHEIALGVINSRKTGSTTIHSEIIQPDRLESWLSHVSSHLCEKGEDESVTGWVAKSYSGRERWLAALEAPGSVSRI
jgi:hypothetical protein